MPSIENTKSPEKVDKSKSDFIGYTGTSITGGLFDEEYLVEWDGDDAIDTYDKMRRSDSQIKMVLRAIKNPIKSATYSHNPDDNDSKSEEIANFLNWNWFDNPLFDFDQWLHEVLTFFEFGFSIHEKKFVAYEHKDFGLVHILGGMGFRKQSTIDEWRIEGSKGLTGVGQVVYGDTVDDQSTGNIFIPVDKLVIFSHDREGDLWEGISMLRPCYGPWFRKNVYLKLNAIGIEKAAIGVPKGTYPRGSESSADKTEFENVLKRFALHESSYVMVPQGYEIDVIQINFDSDKITKSIEYEDLQIAKSIVFQFLELGTSGGTGSYALGEDLSSMALASLRFIGKYICKQINKVNTDLVRWNFGDVDYIPKAVCTGIDQKKGKELAETLKFLTDSRIVRPDDRLEKSVRERYDLPPAENLREDDIEEITEQEPANPIEIDRNQPDIQPEPIEKDKDKMPDMAETKSYFRDFTIYERKINFSEIENDFDSSNAKLLRRMKMNLTKMSDRALRGVESLLKKNQQNRIKAATQFSINQKIYENDLKNEYGQIVAVGIEQARRDFTVKLSEFHFADNDVTQYLGEHVKAALQLQAEFQAGVHATEVKKIVALGIIKGVENKLDDSVIISKISTELEDYVESNKVDSAARIAVSQNINRGRDGFFFDKENIKQLQAFQYSAVLDGRTTDICLSLDGKIMLPSDPDLASLRPPNHYGCRSILIPITVNEEKPEISGIQIDPTNPSLVNHYKDIGKPVPKMDTIVKSRNL